MSLINDCQLKRPILYITRILLNHSNRPLPSILITLLTIHLLLDSHFNPNLSPVQLLTSSIDHHLSYFVLLQLQTVPLFVLISHYDFDPLIRHHSNMVILPTLHYSAVLLAFVPLGPFNLLWWRLRSYRVPSDLMASVQHLWPNLSSWKHLSFEQLLQTSPVLCSLAPFAGSLKYWQLAQCSLLTPLFQALRLTWTTAVMINGTEEHRLVIICEQRCPLDFCFS